MKVLFILAALAGIAISTPISEPELTYEEVKHFFEPPEGDEPLCLEDLEDHVPERSDLVYYFYNLQNTEYPAPPERRLIYKDIDKVKKYFNAEKNTLLILHGYFTNSSNKIDRDVVLSMLEGKHDYNVIVADYALIWTRVNGSVFFKNVENIGGWVADFVNDLVKTYKLQLSKTMIIGFSAGGMLAGATGKALKGEVQFITGLDTKGITTADAQFVSYVHTSSGSTGRGHADYFPNGGHNQTGCPDDKGCSHGRGFLYFSESVNDNKFISKKCDTFEDFKAGKCDKNPSSIMGTLTPDVKARGSYFLSTNSKWPYARG